ncbi:MAG: uracil-DNA glycosylase [Spirochaetaceae bacterium]|jgi:DNA polymerase|nr:uracil-DNA glycosylase [Spirochaetaceae bacterium]
MTAEEKTVLAKALDLAEDYLRDGYARSRGEYVFAEDPPENVAVSLPPQPADSLEALKEDIRRCTACPLHTVRGKPLIGDGAGGPLVLILGDAPSKEDEEAGTPFAGPAGELLDRMLGAIALSREANCYLTHRIKCRPPEDGSSHAPEAASLAAAACAPFLKRELALLKPVLILTLESSAGCSPKTPELSGIPCFSTYHPALIRSDERLKRPAWEQLKVLSATLTGLDRDYADALRISRRG